MVRGKCAGRLAGTLAVACLLVAGCGGGARVQRPPTGDVAQRPPTGDTAPPTAGRTAAPPAPRGTAPPPAAPLPSRTPVSLDMVNATTGWAVTASRVLRTRDGAATWRDVTPPALPPGARLAHGAFAGTRSAWVPYVARPQAAGAAAPAPARAGVASTSDGGATWHLTPLHLGLGATPTFVTFPDARHGWLLVDRGAGMMHEAVDVYRTANGGGSWTKVASAGPRDTSPGSLPFVGDKSGIAFVDATTGWVTTAVPADGNVELWRSTDGGRTWHLQRLPDPPGHPLAQLEIGLDPPVFFAGGRGVLTLGAPLGRRWLTEVYTTVDGGRTWRPSPGLVTPGPLSVGFSGPAVGWALAGDGGRLYVTRDGAATWTGIDARQAFGASAEGATVWFTTADDGLVWLDGMRTLWRTADGGRTWRRT